MARHFHAQGFNLVLHYHRSQQAAEALKQELETARQHSVSLVSANLLDTAALPVLVKHAASVWQRLDILVNNASSFYPTPLAEANEQHWSDLMGTNLKAPFFLAQAAYPYLKERAGCIVNIVDIHADRPLKGYPVYSMAKAGLVMMTKALAGEMGPEVRVNAIAPGAILWPEHAMDDVTQEKIISRTFLKRQGSPDDIARAALFLIRDAAYTSGHILTVDGGRSLNS